MVKRLLLITLSLFLLLTAILLAGGWWVLSTPQGSRWLLSGISRWTAVTVEARHAEGRLLDRLRLEGVRVTWPRGRAQLEQVELGWQPAALLRGHLAVDEISLAGGEVAWEPSPAAETEKVGPAFAWPRLTGWLLRLRASLAALRVENIELQPPEGGMSRLEHLTAGLEWQGGKLSIDELDVDAAGYRLQGSAAAGFLRPLLRLDLQLELPAAAAGVEIMALHAEMLPAAGVDIAGPLELRGVGGGETRLELAGELAVRGDTLHLRHFELTRPGQRGTLSGAGEVRLAGGAPQWRLRASVAELDLEAVTGVATDLAGHLEGAGEGAEFNGSFDLSNRGPGWRSARLSGPLTGTAAGIDFPQLAGTWLRGDLTGDLRLAWREGFALSGNLRGRRLDTAIVTPDWPGQVNLDLAGDLRIPPSEPLVAHLRGRLRDSILRGKPLSGEVEADLAGDDLRLAVLELHGDGFDISGRGRLAERIDFSAAISRLSGLVPAAQGELAAQGWLRWRGGALAGEVDGHGRQLAYGDLQIEALELAARLPAGTQSVTVKAEGSGIASGRLQLQRVGLNLAGTVQEHRLDLQLLWPDGQLQAAAGGGWRDGRWQGTVNRLDGQDAEAGPWRLAEPAGLEVGADRLHISDLRLAGRGGERLRLDGDLAWRPWQGEGEAQWEDLDLSRLNPWLAEVALTGSGSGKARLRWQEGRPLELSGALSAFGRMTHGEQTVEVRHLAAEFDWSTGGLQADLAVTLEDGGGVDARFTTPEPLRAGFPRQGEAQLFWQEFDLALFNPWLAPAEIAARSSGESRLRWQPDGAIALVGRVEAAGTLAHEEIELALRQVETELAWDADGLRATLTLELAEGGRLGVRARSAQPGRLALPEQGSIEADWSELDLTRLRPWLPEGIEVAGRLEGKAAGDWLPGGRLALAGEIAIDAGRLSWQTEAGEVGADLRTARLDWDWRGETLSGALELVLAEFGQAQGSFRLPLPARLPTAMNPAGALQLEFAAKVREQGLLATVFPGLVHESRGELAVQVQVGGSWQDPDLAGSLHLAGAGAYLPAAGIELREVELAGELAGDELRIASFSARSGPGQVEGSGSVRLQRGRPVAYQGTLKGERFEAVHLPELHLLLSPELTIEGTAERLQVRGEVRVPELSVLGREQRGVVRESPDVVLVDAAEPAGRAFPLALDIRIHVVLGDHVLVKVAGVDAQLAGELDLQVAGPEEITAVGEIRVTYGIYSAYGAQLKIERGRLLYSGGPVDQPTLDILALRTVGEVKAGVQVGGTPRAPVVKLYSEPAMPDTDVLAYVILGHPMGGDSGQAGLLMAAAGALLARGESAVLQDRLKRRLGIDVIEVNGGSEDIAGSMVTIGKYLSPRLYLSYGQSLFTNVSEARLRYTISKKWELESKAAGERSGVDLYYKIEFR